MSSVKRRGPATRPGWSSALPGGCKPGRRAIYRSARQRAEELARDAELRLTPPRPAKDAAPVAHEKTPSIRLRVDTRIPPPGTILTRSYKGETLQVQVLEHGFACAGQVYPTLSAVAKAVTGSHCNGYLFFRLPSKEVAS